jgi:hypothetical protein
MTDDGLGLLIVQYRFQFGLGPHTKRTFYGIKEKI